MRLPISLNIEYDKETWSALLVLLWIFSVTFAVIDTKTVSISIGFGILNTSIAITLSKFETLLP